MESVEFATIERFPDCRFGSDGSFWRLQGGQWVMSRHRPGTKYRLVKVAGESHYLHRLIAEAFHGRKPKHWVCRHLNDDPTDNRKSNLEWGTCSQNAQDAIRNGRFANRRTRRDAALARQQSQEQP